MYEYELHGHRVLAPATVEEMLRAIGERERNHKVEIVLSSELVADLCVRLVRLEDKEEDE